MQKQTELSNWPYKLVRFVNTQLRASYHALIKGNTFECIFQPLHRHGLAGMHRMLERSEARYERQVGIHTIGNVQVNAENGIEGDATNYEPSAYWVIDRVLDELPVMPDDIFVDLGCGKGRVLCHVAARKLRKVIGVEMIPELTEAAIENARQCRALTPIEIVQGDAGTFNLHEVTVIYLYNPFGESTLGRVLANIRQSLVDSPRKLRIVYVNPVCAHLLDTQHWLTAEKELFNYVRVWRANTAKVFQS